MGLFITFEGIDGAGKSTQAALLKTYLDEKGVESILIREPGGTEVGEKLRAIIKDKANKIDHITEVYLFATARAQLVREVIKPALKENKIVICDRFVQSSLVYQGVARGLSQEVVAKINEVAIDGLAPDVTFFVEVPPSTTQERKEIGELDRIEQEGNDFIKKVHAGYKKMIEDDDKKTIVIINGKLPKEQVHEQIKKQINQFI